MFKRVTVLFFLFALVCLPSGVGLAQDKSLVWDRYDVNITVLPNADLEIEEIQEITFTSGSFQFGYRAIPLDRVENLTDIQVYERQGDRLLEYTPAFDERDYTFESYVNDDNEHAIYWHFPQTEYTSHTYVIRYRVQGGLRIYDGGDQVWWKAIGADHNFPVTQSRVKVNLPGSFASSQLVTEAYGAEATNYMPDSTTVIFDAAGISSGEELEVRVQFPHGAVEGQVPAWQAEDDRRREAQERYGPILNIGFLFLGFLILLGGPIAVYVLWYMRGRDQSADLIADYIPEPPSDLPPGAAGTLIDEQADMEDVLATLVDLARRGALHIEERNEPGFLGIGSGREFIFHRLDEGIAVKPYEFTLMDELFDSKNKVEMSDLRYSFYSVLPRLRQQLYQDVVEAGYFPRSPQKTRQMYMGLGVALLILSVVGGCFLLALTADYSGMVVFPTAAMILTSVGFLIVGRHMPRKTRSGAEESAKWVAFKRYLRNIENYGELEEAKEQFEKYLPYAIAFGIERRYMNMLSKVDTPAPTWYGPIYGGGHHHHPVRPVASAGEGGHSAPGPLAGEGGQTPTLSDMSRGMGTSLQSMSVGLGSMLSSASRTFSSTPSSSGSGSSGGGFSGGGFSGGGGGGGGSAGFG